MADPTILIIGAGSGGLACAIALRTRVGFKDFVIYEKAEDVGGTWRDNVYPGCSSDVPMAFYSLSTDVHDWKHSHGSQEDIQDYWVSLANKYDIYPHVVFNRKVVSCQWIASTHRYTVISEDTKTGDRFLTTSAIVISAIGILEMPRFAKIPGLDTFKGDLFHSARWNKSVKLAGKRVGVVGNGASATQFVPIISDDPSTEVIQFCRTPNWLFPDLRKKYTETRRTVFRHLPFLNRLLRYTVYLRFEFLYFSIFGLNIFRPLMTKLMKTYMTYTAPKEYHARLIPSFALGCKRIIFDTNWLRSLHKPNLGLNWDGIERVVEDGVVTKKGEHIPFDVLIFASGYASDFYPIPVTGRGKTIEEYYAESDGPKAYLGTTLPYFPNYFMIFGPNTATGHTSVIFTNECQIEHILQLIKPILDHEVRTVEVTVEAADAYNDKIHGLLNKSVFTSCLSWYRVGGNGKITNAFPGAATTFWRWLRKVNWDHFTGIGVRAWVTKQRRQARNTTVRKVLFASALLLGTSWYFRSSLLEHSEVLKELCNQTAARHLKAAVTQLGLRVRS